MFRSLWNRRIAFVLLTGLIVYPHKVPDFIPFTVTINAAPNQTSGAGINPIDAAETADINAGEFVMGSNQDELEQIFRRLNWKVEWIDHTKSEQPAHRVRIDGFRIYRHHVTVAQYRKYCDKTGRSMPAAPRWGWDDNHPIVNVSWNEAKAYCGWAGGRLPYEAEWEYAARGGQTGIGGRARTVFVWGDEYPKSRVANLAEQSFKKSSYYNPNFHLFTGYDDGYPHTSPVGEYPPNGYRLHDMAGNVLQWCEDWFDSEYYRRSPSANPTGPTSGQRRVLRGGAFDLPPEMARIARRLSNLPDIHHDEKGFRCVLKQ